MTAAFDSAVLTLMLWDLEQQIASSDDKGDPQVEEQDAETEEPEAL